VASPPRSALSLSTIATPGCSLSPSAFCSHTPALEGVEPCSPCPNGARACSRARTPSQASCHASADTPNRDAAELEPHRAVYHLVAVLVRELHLTAARSCMRSTKLSPLLPLLEFGEHVRACEPNLTAAQPIATGTPSSRASFPPRRASAGPTRVRVRSPARERIRPHRRRQP
jgi:hypothetical protein